MIDNFIQTFANLLSNGLSKVSNIALVIASILAVIDFLFTFINEYANDFQQIFKKLFHKTINYAFVFALIKGYKAALDAITLGVFNLGYKFFPPGTGGGNGKFPSFDSIFNNLKLSIYEMEKERSSLSWSEFGTQLIYVIIILIGFFMIFLIIKEIIVSYIEFRLTATVGLLLVPFLALEHTKTYGSKLWNSILNGVSKLLISLILTGITLQILRQKSFVSGNGTSEIGAAIGYIFMLGLSAYLITNTKELGSMLANGSVGGRVGSGLVSAATGIAIGGVATLATGGAAVLGGATKGVQAARSGQNIRGVLNAMKEGATQGKDVLRSSRVGKIGSKLGKGLQNTVDYASGNRSFTNIASDIGKGVFGTVGQQIGHDSNDVAEKIADIKSGSYGKVSDFINNDYTVSKSAKEAFNTFINTNGDERFSERFKRAFDKYKSHRAFGKSTEGRKTMYEKAEKAFNDNKRAKENAHDEYMKRRFTRED